MGLELWRMFLKIKNQILLNRLIGTKLLSL